MAFSRHNIEKRRLIELVRLNPILWDCRLPHYKRSDKKKALKWNELGRLFNVNGERVQRTFTSLREIFRRELNHEKMLGTTRFKSKWEYYEAMAFLKEVIRERKSRERIKNTAEAAAHSLSHNNNNQNSNNNNNNNSSSAGLDEYQYFAPSDPNNPNNQPQPPPPPLQTPIKIAEPAILTTTISTASDRLLSISQLPVALQQQAQHLQALQLQPDVTLTTLHKQLATPTTAISVGAVAPLLPHLVASPTQVLSSSRSCSSSPSIYIKDEPDSQDETTRSTSNGKAGRLGKLATIKPMSKRYLKSRLQLPKGGGGGTYATPPPHLIINANNELIDADAGDLDDDEDDVEYDDDDEDVDDDVICPSIVDVDMLGGSSLTSPVLRGPPSARELLYSKFGDFLSARLNTLHEAVANELMNKILLLIAEK